jgi:hypothetical protein
MLGHDDHDDNVVDSSRAKVARKRQVRKGLRINIIKAAQKKTKTDRHGLTSGDRMTMDGVIVTRLLSLSLPGMGTVEEVIDSEVFADLHEKFKFSGPSAISMHEAKLSVHFTDGRVSLRGMSSVIRNSNSPFTTPLEVVFLTQDRICQNGGVVLSVVLKKKSSDADVKAKLYLVGLSPYHQYAFLV